VAQRLFKACENGFIVSGFDIDDPVRRESSLRQRWSKQILVGNAPQHTTPGPRRDPGGEQCSGSRVDRVISAAGHFVQRAERQAAFRQVLIDGLDAERQYCPLMPRPTLKASNALAKRRDSGNVDRRINAPLLPVSQANRSLFVLVVLGVNGYVVRHGERRSGAQGGAAVTNEREVVPEESHLLVINSTQGHQVPRPQRFLAQQFFAALRAVVRRVLDVAGNLMGGALCLIQLALSAQPLVAGGGHRAASLSGSSPLGGLTPGM
jgi:hypothetical protein